MKLKLSDVDWQFSEIKVFLKILIPNYPIQKWTFSHAFPSKSESEDMNFTFTR
jgi:hypothetical protein